MSSGRRACADGEQHRARRPEQQAAEQFPSDRVAEGKKRDSEEALSRGTQRDILQPLVSPGGRRTVWNYRSSGGKAPAASFSLFFGIFTDIYSRMNKYA